MRVIENPVTSAGVDLLKKYMEHGEVVFIGPISQTMRTVIKIDGNFATLDNENVINLCQCDNKDFGMLTRLTL